MPRQLICPLDSAPLTAHSETQLKCPHGHHFDRARQGYWHLLPVQQKRSKAPGDNKSMVAARRRLLNAGCFQAVSQSLANVVMKACESSPSPHILDAGCGEGYYLRELQKHYIQHHKSAILSGLDISKFAIQAAAAQDKTAAYWVASNRAIPLADNSLDMVICAFGFPVYSEFSRCLKSNGDLLLVEAAEHHLIEIREQLYPQISATKTKQPDAVKWPQFSHQKTHSISTQQTFAQNQLSDLLIMTPHGHRAKKERIERLLEHSSITVTLDVTLTHLKKND